MSFVDKLTDSIVRPIYRAVFERPLWLFLRRVKTFFFAEIGVQLGNIEGRFPVEDAVNDQRWMTAEQRWTALEERIRSLEGQGGAHRVAILERLQHLDANNAAQWTAVEQLLLALFRQPEIRIPEQNCALEIAQEPIAPSVTDRNKSNAAVTLR